MKIKLSDLKDNKNNISRSIYIATWHIIEKWIRVNYDVKDLSYKYDNKREIYKVSSKGNISIINNDISNLTNGDFEWDVVKGKFNCSYCINLKSLGDLSKKTINSLYYAGCYKLIGI